jgi:hypothetical protein
LHENYQIKIVIPSDIPKSDYPSIRFLENENSGLLPYWIENCDNGATPPAVVYENVAGSGGWRTMTTRWMYYHNVTGQATMVQNRINWATRLHQSALFNNGVMFLYYKEENLIIENGKFNYRKPEEAATK